MKKRILSVILITTMLTALLASCGKKEEKSANNGTKSQTSNSETNNNSGTDTPSMEPIQIAVAAPMTGDNSEYGIGFYNAALLKAKEWNEKGGVLGRKIEILQYDDKNTPEEAATIAQKIVSDNKVSGVIGHFASGVCMTAAPIYQENKIIEISPSASHPDYSGIGDFIFRNNTIISKEGAASVDIAVNNLGKKNIGIISIMTDWGSNTSKIIKELIEEKGQDAKVVAHEEVMEGSDDYTPAITKLNEAGADVVICCGMYNLVAPVAKQYKQINPDIEIVGFSNSYSHQLLELGQDAVEGVCFPVIFFSESDEPAVASYVETFTKEYGAAPSALTSQAYDSVGLLLTAIEAAGSTDSDAVKAKLYEIEYPGVTGNTKFDSNGDVDKEFIKVTIKEGKFIKMN